jgi:hypothetical protein
MPPSPERFLSFPRLGGKSPVILFLISLIAFVTESQLTQVRVLLHYIHFSYLTYLCFTSIVCTEHPPISTAIFSLVRYTNFHCRYILTYPSGAVMSPIPHLRLFSHYICYSLSSQRLYLWKLYLQAYLSPSSSVMPQATRTVLPLSDRHSHTSAFSDCSHL